MDTGIFLTNNSLRLQFNSTGAELTSIYSVKDRVEFLWQGPSALWGRGAPILFPVIASLRDDRYYHNDKSYAMKIHGFALHEQFSIHHKTQDELCFILHANERLSKIYPFDYEVLVTYQLKGDRVNIKYEVINTGSHTMYFSIGAHPTFNCPFFEGESFTDYYLEFEKEEDLKSIKMEGPYLIQQKKNIKTQNRCLSLSKDLFKENALIFDDLKSSSLTLRSIKNDWGVTIDFEGFPYLGIFANSYAESDKFLCLEPWFGIPDYSVGEKEISKKSGILRLESGKEFSCSHVIKCTKH